MKSIILAGIGLASMAIVLVAEPGGLQKIIRKDGKVLAISNGNAAPFHKPVVFPGEVLVNTNGQFTVQKGKIRELKEGQTLTADGVLHNPDGSVAPVIDHITVRGGRVFIVKDGEPTPLVQNFPLADGSVISPADATIRGHGKIRRLLDGHLLKLDGTPLKAQDTVGMQKGKVFVFKDGTRLELQPAQIMVMSDGTRVHGNGTVIAPDGKTRNLKEGDTLLVEGPTLSQR